MANQSQNNHLHTHCECQVDKERVKKLTQTICTDMTNILDSHPNFASFIEAHLLSFQQEMELFLNRLFEAQARHSIKVSIIWLIFDWLIDLIDIIHD